MDQRPAPAPLYLSTRGHFKLTKPGQLTSQPKAGDRTALPFAGRTQQKLQHTIFYSPHMHIASCTDGHCEPERSIQDSLHTHVTQK